MRALFFASVVMILLSCGGTKQSPTATSGPDKPAPTVTSAASNVPGTLTWEANAGWTAIGTFDQWGFQSFDLPNGDFTKVKAVVEVDVNSVNTAKKGLESHMREDDYLDVKGYPSALININGAEKQADGSYLSQATIDLKGTKKIVPLKFTISDNNQVVGTTELMRKDFGVGGKGPRNLVLIKFDFKAPL